MLLWKSSTQTYKSLQVLKSDKVNNQKWHELSCVIGHQKFHQLISNATGVFVNGHHPTLLRFQQLSERRILFSALQKK